MSHQVNFYALPADVAKLEIEIRALEPMLVLHSRSPTAEPQVVPSLTQNEGAKPWLFYSLVRERDLAEVVSRHIPAQGYWTVDVEKSPVVEFNCPGWRDKMLGRGREYYVDGFYGSDGAWFEKPESFKAWAKAVLSSTKQVLRRHGIDYIGDDALTWLEREGGRLVS